MSMNDREYKKWVKDIVIKPLRRSWDGDGWSRALTSEMREALLMAQCMSIVMAWCSFKKDDSHTIDPEEIMRLVRVAQEIHREDNPRDYEE